MKERTIKIRCDACGNETVHTRTSDMPNNAVRIVADYCTRKKCAKKHEGDYWREWFEDKYGNEILDE